MLRHKLYDPLSFANVISPPPSLVNPIWNIFKFDAKPLVLL
jgi:hypothetical protein